MGVALLLDGKYAPYTSMCVWFWSTLITLHAIYYLPPKAKNTLNLHTGQQASTSSDASYVSAQSFQVCACVCVHIYLVLSQATVWSKLKAGPASDAANYYLRQQIQLAAHP